MDDPTQTGGQERPTNPRDAAIAQIAQQAHANVAPDLAAFDEASGEIQPAPREEAPEVQAEPEQAEAPEQKAPEKPAPRKYAIVVDGQSLEIDEEKIIEAGKRTLQKESAADRRLQQASEELRQAQALREQLLRASQDPSQQWAPSQDAPQQQPATQGLDPTMLVPLVKTLVYTENAGRAASQFWEEFPDIAGDPFLRNMAVQLEDHRIKHAEAVGEPLGDPMAAYRKHGETIRNWLKERAGGVAPKAEIPADKQERKRTITTVTAANAKAPAPQEKKPLTTSEIIEQARQARTRGRQLFQRIQ